MITGEYCDKGMKQKAQQVSGRSNMTCCLQNLLAHKHINICKSMGGSNNRIGLLPFFMRLLKVWTGERNEDRKDRTRRGVSKKKKRRWAGMYAHDDGTVTKTNADHPHRNTDGNSRTKADSRQWENPKTWPILHQGITGPIQSGRPPLPPQLPALTSCGYPPSLSPPPSVSRPSVKQLPCSPASRSVTQQPRPASLTPPSSLLPSSPLASLWLQRYSNVHYSRGGERHDCAPVSFWAWCCLPFIANLSLSPSSCDFLSASYRVRL